MKKHSSKTITAKLYPAKKYEKKNKEKCIKNKLLSDNIYSIANLSGKVCLMSTKAEDFIKSFKLICFYLYRQHSLTFMVGLFFKKG